MENFSLRLFLYLSKIKNIEMKRQLIISICIIALALNACSPKTTDDIESQYINSENAKIHCKSCGNGEQTILFVHGFGCDMKAWDYQVKDLCGDYRLVFIDLPGYGKSDKPHTDYTLDYFAESVRSVMDSLHIERAILVGHSLGTPICRQLYFSTPERVSAICDVDGVYCFYPADTIYTEAYQASLNDFARLFHGDECKHNITQFAKQLSCYNTPAEVCNYTISTMPETPEYVASSTMDNLIDHKYWNGQKITVPALIFCTQNSDIPPDNYQKMDNLYTDMHYIELTDIGHFIMMENPKMFNEELVRWIENIKH